MDKIRAARNQRSGAPEKLIKVEITSEKNRFIDFREILYYGYLIWLMVKRDFVVKYKQTVLGPTWAFLQPVMNTIVFALVFGRMANLTPTGVPEFFFYFSAQIPWIFFSTSLSGISTVFLHEAGVMSKVYYPRIVAPIVLVLSSGITLLIQLVMYFLTYTVVMRGFVFRPELLALPLAMVHLAVLAMGAGCAISGLTTRYRDLVMLVGFGISLWMYLSPVAYDVSIVPQRLLRFYFLNPATAPIMLPRET